MIDWAAHLFALGRTDVWMNAEKALLQQPSFCFVFWAKPLLQQNSFFFFFGREKMLQQTNFWNLDA